MPTGATTGTIAVSGPNGSDQSYGAFTVDTSTAPHITSFTPTSGAAGTAVSIFGSGFTGTTQVRFNATAVNTFNVANDGKITTVVPSGATTGKISVTTPAGTDSSGSNFTVSGPKITSFSPNSGPVGTTVTIRGSHLTGVNSVRFNGTAAAFAFVNDGEVTTVVPGGATTGPISLSTPSGTATTSTFSVTGGNHARSVSLSLTRRRHLFAVGSVSVNDGYSACKQHIPVVVKRFHRGRWRWVATTSTGQDGSYRAFIPDRSGRYRSKASKIRLVNGVTCGGALSNVVRHHH